MISLGGGRQKVRFSLALPSLRDSRWYTAGCPSLQKLRAWFNWCCSVENSSSGLIFRKKRAKNGHFFNQKTGEKRAKLEFFKKKNGRFEDFLFHFFFGVLTVLLYLLVYL